MKIVCSPEIQNYFDSMDAELKKIFDLAQTARSKNLDPEPFVDIPLATSVAQKTEALISSIATGLKNSGLAAEIEGLEKKYGAGDWRVALEIAKQVAEQKFCEFKDLREAIEVGIRTGFAYVTLGSVSAPLEGFVELKFKKRFIDGKDYMALYFAGPVRGAGGTAVAVCLLVADYLRQVFGIAEYDITDVEVARYQVELDDYMSKVAHRQYKPTAEEIAFMVKSMKIEVTGDPTEIYEVSQHKRLPRVETDIIRGGMALVMTEGPPLKAEKFWKQIQKWGKDYNLDNWGWLKDFIQMKHSIHSAKTTAETEKISPIDSYLTDIVAGRPILSYPMAKGGFRIRYGRSRLTGLAATAIHPASMAVLNDYVATGTQIKTERPGKATVFAVCNSIEGPIVRLENGDVLKLDDFAKAKSVRNKISEILFLGDLLISYGDFSESGQRLVPAGYCEEWWAQEVQKATQQDAPKIKTAREALEFAEKTGTPLHPKWTYFWKDIAAQQFTQIFNAIQRLASNSVQADAETKRAFELAGIPHTVNGGSIVFAEDDSIVLEKLLKSKPQNFQGSNGLECINTIAGIAIRDKAGTYIGTRMGRPEKAKLRALKGAPAGLFPVGKEGGRFRSLNEATANKTILTDAPIFNCLKCNKLTIYPSCETCSEKAESWRICPMCKRKTKKLKCHTNTIAYERRAIDADYYITVALGKLGMQALPPLVKGVKGTWNKDHIAENVAKAILRAKHKLTVNKDGTIRFDGTQLPITHFKPSEIGTSVEQLKQLGYTRDIEGKELQHDSQTLELLPQDTLLPACPVSPDESAEDILTRACNFIDELLEKFYGLPKYYNVKTKYDLIGHQVIGLAPHTSCGITMRIIGFAQAQGIYAHPYMHAAMRRNCDGDETCIMLALDAFLNFSRQYLPDRRGGRSMDAPLVLNTILVPAEVDTEAHGLDTAKQYPLEFYQATQEYKYPWEIKVEQVRDRLSTEAQYEGFGFTHTTDDMNAGVLCSAYKTLPTMLEKLAGQLELAARIRAVALEKVATLVIDKHFLRDIKGNLRGFTTQEFRCISCNAKYRRTPLKGSCTSCNGRLVFTIAEGTIRKYLEAALKLASMDKMPPYIKQTLELLKRRIDSIFGKEATKQIELQSFFGK